MAFFDPSTWFGPQSPYGSPLPQAGANPYNPATAFQYDPTSIRRAAISNALLSAGAAMLGAGPSRTPQNFGTSLGQGVAAGLQGADQGAQQAMQRQQFAQQSASGAQAYKAGQQQLVGGALNNQFALEKVNAMIDDMNQQLPPDQQKPHITISDLMQNPDLVNTVAAQAAGGQQQPVSAAVAPQLGGVNPMAPAPTGQVVPGVTGGGPEVPASAPPPSAAPPAAAPQMDPNAQWYNSELGKIANLQWVAPDVYKQKLDTLKSDPRYLALSTAATAQATAGATPAHWENVTKIAGQYNDDPNIQRQQQIAQIAPTFFAAAAAGADPKTGQQIALAGSPYTDQQLIGMAAKIFTPAMRLRGGNVVTEEDIPNIAGEIQHLIPGYVAGKSHLDPAAREAIISLVKKQLQTTDQLYSTSFDKLANRAKDMGVNQNEFGGTPRFAMTKQEYDALPGGALYYDPNGQLGKKP